MKIHFALIGVLCLLVFPSMAQGAQPPVGLIPEEGLACKTNADCVDVYAGCFEGAVNEKFSDQVKDNFRKLSATIDCQPVTQQTRTPVCQSTNLPSVLQCHLIEVIK